MAPWNDERSRKQIAYFLAHRIRSTEDVQPPPLKKEDKYDPIYEAFIDKHPRLERIK